MNERITTAQCNKIRQYSYTSTKQLLKQLKVLRLFFLPYQSFCQVLTQIIKAPLGTKADFSLHVGLAVAPALEHFQRALTRFSTSTSALRSVLVAVHVLAYHSLVLA